ncbi:hypothetical protein PVAP13_2NG029409 [Panicum virgatum]|uniref:Uncharacterized protein n=1 Tax=Panicum virgatum TaxID=38727 RepID=A0A8T0VFZ2_PANVG|nr:hypothetical protein PVAP13_2NG029409 [Panicum virgatum]
MDKATTCGSAGVVVRVLRIMERGGKLHGVPGLFIAPSSPAYGVAACVFTISIKGQHTGVRCRGVRRRGVRRQVPVSPVLPLPWFAGECESVGKRANPRES